MCKAKMAVAVVAVGCVGLAGSWMTSATGQSSASTAASAVPSQEANSPEPWQKEFDAICSKTQDAMTYSQEQLTELVQRCDALAPQLEKLDETRKKVYTRRLRICRGLYAYVLESKKNEKK